MMIIKLLLAFIFGGMLCALAQLLIDKTALTPAKILVLYVSVGILIGGIGLYEPLLEAVGAGISVPLIGFGGSLALGVREAVDRMGMMGILKGPLSSMSAGVTLALTLSYIYSLIAGARPKRM